MTIQLCQVRRVVAGQPTSDGAGVKLTRMIGTPALQTLDPFLMLDCFESDQPQDYLAGFPDHPHRGFETVTYILNGRMRHKDNKGHESVIEAGGVQWMTAGKGVIHSEMPEQENGLLQGFQLWLNLPASEKMCEPQYQEYSANDIPSRLDNHGHTVRIIAGTSEEGIAGPVIAEHTQAIYLDVSLVAGKPFSWSVPLGHQGFIYVVSGAVQVADNDSTISAYQLGLLSEGNRLDVNAVTESRIFILLAKPLREPIAWGGPFVMNTREEVMQAYADFQHNRF